MRRGATFKYFRHTLMALALLCVACTQGDHLGQAVHAPKPPADYVYIGSGDTSEEKKIDVNVNFDLMKSKDPDSNLSLLFGMIFAGSVSDAKPVTASSKGTGLSHLDPILFDSVEDSAELDATANYLAARFPDRDKVIGHLFRSPTQRYLVWTIFETDAGNNALLFDVTRWAAFKRKIYAQ